MKIDINIELRTSILTKALDIENSINDLTVSQLTIFDKKKTKNFGNKAGISFKSKIDLLFDIEILTKEEHYNLELQMIFRNKFLHDLSFNNFEYALKNLDSGVMKKLENYTDLKNELDIERKYKNAYHNLYLNNVKVISEKFEKRENEFKMKEKFIKDLLYLCQDTSKLYNKLILDLTAVLEPKKTENTEVYNSIHKIIIKHGNEFRIISERHNEITNPKNYFEELYLGLLK